MDWFKAITGFEEGSYQETKSRLFEREGYLHSKFSPNRYAIGDFCVPSLAVLRQRRPEGRSQGRLSVTNISGDVRNMHLEAQYRGALFQVASQFNMLEMINPGITPEHGVTGYQYDMTQGPACAMAAGAATIYRNYLVPLEGQEGQSAERQIDGLADLGAKLAIALGVAVDDLWNMENGYAMPTKDSLLKIGKFLEDCNVAERQSVKGCLRIGLHTGCQVTDVPPEDDVLVSQAFCSALPVAYTAIDPQHWEPFARLILEASYEAAVLAGVENMRAGRSDHVLLTQLGGGAFGNREEWIRDAIMVALETVAEEDLKVILVSYGTPSEQMRAIERAFS